MTHRLVRNVMTTGVRSVGTEASVKAIADGLALAGISAMPVLDENAAVVGVVSESDLLRKITHRDVHDEGRPLFRRHRADRAKAAGRVARDLMTAPAVTIPPTATVVEAARLMEARRVKHLPVVTGTGKLVGVVSRSDLIRMLARSDDAVRDEIRTDVLDRLLAAPSEVTVTVADGVATLSGGLPRRSEAEILVEFARRVDGVVHVLDQLTWTEDDTEYRALLEQVSRPGGPLI